MTQPWTFSREPPREAHVAGSVVLVEGSTFCISDTVGDVSPLSAHGLFVRDTRVLSRWQLTIDDVTPQALTVQRGDPYTATYISRMPPPDRGADSTLMVVRRRYIGNGMREDLTIRNIGQTEVHCVVTLTVAADFADLFEVKDGRAHPAVNVITEVAGDTLKIARRRGNHEQSILVRGHADPDQDAGALRWELTLPARGQWTTVIEAVPAIDAIPMPLRHPRGNPVEHTEPARRLQEWRRRSPRSAPPTPTSRRCCAAAWTTSARCESSIPSIQSALWSPPACPGSWRCSAGTPC